MFTKTISLSISNSKIVSRSNFLKLSLFLLFLLLVLSGLNYFIQNLLQKSPVGTLAKVNAVMSRSMDEEITIWGASTARAHFDAELMEKILNVGCFNMGMDGTPFQQYNGLLKEYIENSKRAKIIVLVVDINGFGARNSLYQSYSWLHHVSNDNIYNSLSQIDTELTFKARYVPLYYITAYDRRFLPRTIKWVYFDSIDEPELSHHGFHPNSTLWQDNQGERYNSSFNVEINADVISEFSSTIAQATQANLKVIIVVPPCYTDGLKLVSNINEFENSVHSLESDNVVILNYLHSNLSEDIRLFTNNTHLNSEGARLFTNQFIVDLSRANVGSD